MRITIHQPEHLPWLGFFHKIAQVDKLVVLDNVQFSKNYFQNRNKVRTPEGWTWLTVPVNRSIETLIKDVTIACDPRWEKKWLDTIYYNYKKTAYFERYFEELSNLLNEGWGKLSDLNIALLRLSSKFLKLQTEFILASELDVSGNSSDLLLNICKKIGADSYLSGISGIDYLKLKDFEEEKIAVEFQEFHHPVYKQLYKPFIPCMSILDLLFNCGNASLDVINGVGVSVMDEVFL